MVLNDEGYFGPICDDDWDSRDAGVVCAQLGFSREDPIVYSESHFGNVYSNFAMDRTRCEGTEATIQDCDYITSDDCGYSEGAGVYCNDL